MEERREQAWHAMTVDGVLAGLKTSSDGLDLTEVRSRREQWGQNQLPDTDVEGWVRILLRQFINPLVLILIGATAISVFLESYLDAGIIGAAVIINAAIGFFQERKVSVLLEELRGHLRRSAIVVRDGEQHVIDAEGLVPGDIISLHQGERVPADARLIRSTSLKTNEAALTGESMPVKKSPEPIQEEASTGDRTSMVFMSTLIEEGSGRAVVVETGARTQIGKIADLIRSERRRDTTPLQDRLSSLGKVLGVVFLLISVLLFGFGVLTGRDPFQMFLTAVAVAVAAVPESLPVSLGIVLAIGAQRILRKGGLVRKMAAAEALGSVNVIATDKTATLTEGNLSIDRIIQADSDESLPDSFAAAVAGQGDSTVRHLIERMALATNAFVENPGDPPDQWQLAGSAIDKAILRSVLRAGIDRTDLKQRFVRKDEIPFDAKRKYSATYNEDSDGGSLVVLGAPEVLLDMSRSDGDLKDRMLWRTGELAAQGFRILALGSRRVNLNREELTEEHISDLTFDGLIVFSDPIRGDVADVIRIAQKAGTRVIMVTGDHAQTAAYVAMELGIMEDASRMVEGKDLPEDVGIVASRYDVYARVTPEDKVHIVDAFKQQGYHIAMLGDGVNDAPSLLRADIGVAVGSGTEVAKDASDLVLLKDSFAIVVEAIRQGRIIFDNIMKATIFLVSDAFTEIILVAGSILFGLPLALLPAQILWVNVIADIFPAIGLAWDQNEEDVMTQRPRDIGSLFSGNVRRLIIMFTVITDTLLFGVFAWYLNATGDVEHARTMVFVALGLMSMIYVFSVRSLHRPVWSINPFGNWFVNAGVAFGVAMYVVAIYVPPVRNVLEVVPLTGLEWGIVAGLSFANIAVFELAKRIFLRERPGTA